MDVMIGETIEVDGKWQKIELRFQELDIQRWLVDHNVVPGTHISTSIAFRICETEARKLVVSHMNRAYPEAYPVAAARAEIEQLNAVQTALIEKINLTA